jgi:UDP:flavonoid glycosyltransferase YjiC (YdhE family)
VTSLTIFTIFSAPHDWLFPRVAAVIHHGGAGTTAEGLRAGVPTMIVPFFGDQYLWASRIEDLRVGIAPFTLKKMTPQKLADAITILITDKQLKANAATMGENIRSQDGLGRAVEFFHHNLKRFTGMIQLTNCSKAA